MATGKLAVKEFKKGKAVHIQWTNAKGTPRDEPVTPAQLAQDLAALVADKTKLAQLADVEVDFDEVQGKPQKVRRKGEPWKPPAAAAPAPRPQQHRQGRGLAPRPASPQVRRELPGEFHNPYNFIPAPPRVTSGPLADARPCGHDRYHADRYTGTISVRLTTVTPLLVADAALAETAPNDHKTLPLRLGPDGRPFIPPTSIKGMLRTAFEAVTNSRFGIFAGHDERLAYRAAAQEGLALVPAIVENGMITLQRGTTDVLPPGDRPEPGRVQHAAWLPRYKPGVGLDPLPYRDGEVPAHGDLVWCWAVRKRHRSNRFDFWGVIEIARSEADLGPQPQRDSEVKKFNGRVCITNQNIGNKHDERVFFEHGMPAAKIPLSDSVKEGWWKLVRNYQSLHHDAIEQRLRKDKKGPDQFLDSKIGRTAWSRHVCKKGAENLEDNTTLCHALVRAEGGQLIVEALYPVMISRKLYERSPLELLEASGNLTPARSIDELSPADRVFGWVSQNSDAATDGVHAYRGNLRIGPVTCHSANAAEELASPGLPLAILGQPKPQQARFYVASNHDGDAQENGLGKEEAGYSDGKSLRGRKVYPHHRHLPPDHWRNPLEDRTRTEVNGVFQEYRRPSGPKGDRDNQNRSITGWVRPGAVFTFDIHVTNLSAEELGALLWLLQLSSEPQAGHFRLGGGKPLGFGSVKLEVHSVGATAGYQVRDGRAVGDSYRLLGEEHHADFEPAAAIDAFKRAVVAGYGKPRSDNAPVKDWFEQVPFIRAFLTAARGFGDGLPVHYPRARQSGPRGPVPPHPDGKAYEWFVANDRERRCALADLAEDTGLPMLEAPDKR
jgi:CRISPR-associated protein (TIGR03986 family)